MSDDLKSQIKKGGIWLFLTNILTIGSQLFSVAILSRLLLPKDFGLQGIGILLMDLTVVFTYPFINKSIVLKKDISKEYIGTASILSVILTSLVGLIFIFAAPLIALFFKQNNVEFIVQCIGIVFFIKGIYQPYQSLFEKELKFKEISNINLIAYWIGYFFVPISLAYLGWGYKSLIIGLVAYEASFLIYYLIKSKITFSYFQPHLAKEIMSDARHLIVQAVGNKLATNGDYLIISKFLGPISLGLYAQAYKIMKMPTNIIGNVINNLSFASLSKINEDNEKLKRAFTYSSFILALFSFPIFFLTLLFSKEIILILLGEKWLQTAGVLQILSFGIFLRMSYKIPGTILKAKQKFALTARIQVIYAFNIILFSLLLIKFDIEGVAVGTLLALIFQYAQLTYYVCKELGMNWLEFIKALIRPILLATTLFVTAAILKVYYQKVLHLDGVIPFVVVVSVLLLFLFAIIKKFGSKLLGENYDWWLQNFKTKKSNKKMKKAAAAS